MDKDAEEEETDEEEFTLEDLIDDDWTADDNIPTANTGVQPNLHENILQGFASLKQRSSGKKGPSGEKKVDWYYACSKHKKKVRITAGTLLENSKIGMYVVYVSCGI
jgi:hypothetical protein